MSRMNKIPKEKVELIEQNLTQVISILKMNGYNACATNLDNVAYDIMESIKTVNDAASEEDQNGRSKKD